MVSDMRRVTETNHPLIDPVRSVQAKNPNTPEYLNARYGRFERTLACPQSNDPSEWTTWRRKLRRALRKTLCLSRLGPVPTPQPVLLETKACDGYRREKIAYEVLKDNWVTAYLLIPESRRKKPAVICPHGHVTGCKENVVGNTTPVGVAYAHELAQRGCVTLAPDNAGMGERSAQRIRKDRVDSTSCFLMWVRLNQMGLDLTGFRVFELMAGLSLLSRHPEVDASRIGCAGLSGGCWLSQVLTSLDRRIKAVILSGFFTTFTQTIWHGHCVCHHPFGIGELCDLPDLSAMIGPRSQFVESGIFDTPYPHEPAFSMVQKAYDLLGAPDQIQLHRYRGDHMFNGRKSIPWMVDQLGA